MQMGAQLGMQTLEASLAALVKEGQVSPSEAMAKTTRPEDLERLLSSTTKAPLSGAKGFGRF
jgi:twitching motility protein PilT